VLDGVKPVVIIKVIKLFDNVPIKSLLPENCIPSSTDILATLAV